LKWAIERSYVPDDGLTLANAIRAGQALAVSDASLKDNFGTAAFAVEGPTSHNRAVGVNIVPGPIKDGDSYRCELAGLIGAVTFVQALCARHNITAGSLRIACDNISTLYVFKSDFVPEPSHESFDLVSCLWNLLKASPVTWHAEHVSGHQIDKKHHSLLTRTELINDEMDNLAKMHWNCLLQSGHSMTPPQHTVTHEGWTIWKKSDNSKLPSPNPKTLFNIIDRQATLDYWSTCHQVQPLPIPRLTPQAITNVDWHACAEAMQQLQLGRRRWVTKHGAENCGVGLTLVFWKKQTHHDCPRCGAPECTTHVLQCLAEGAEQTWQDNKAKLVDFFASSFTHPDIQTALLSRLDSFRYGTPQILPTTLSPQVIQAVVAQDTIDWKNLLEGLPATRWKHIQQRHYKRNHIIHKTGRKWMRMLLKHLHNLAWAQWDHRNDVLHNPQSSRNRALSSKLQVELIQEQMRGPEDLPPRDRSHFSHSIASLLNKSEATKQAWLANVTAARHRQARRRNEATDARANTEARSRVLTWSRTGILPRNNTNNN
jgi:hypothetical protein